MSKKFTEVKRQIIHEFCQAPPHTKLPSERDLIEHFGYSRPTIQKALTELEKENIIYRVPRQGSFVADDRLRKSLNHLQSFKDDILADNDIPSTRLISFEKVNADEKIAGKLNLNPGDCVYKIVRLRYRNSTPIIFDTSYFCPFAIQGIGMEPLVDSIYEYMENKCGLILSNAVEIIDAVLPDQDVADYLEVGLNEPIIRIDKTAYLSDGRAFEYTISCKNPKKYCLEIHSSR